MSTLFVAVDGGAQEALRPVAAEFGAALADAAGNDAESQTYWAELVARTQPQMLVVGTSDSARGRRVEAAARRACREARVPIAAIEDFPGNYASVPGGPADLVLVESEGVREFHCAKDGSRAGRFEVIAPARYDPYRAKLAWLRAATSERWATADSLGNAPTLLWAGQPETEDALRTLRALLPAARELGAEVLFKAHPRDAGYARGDYRELFHADSGSIRDCTAMVTADALALAPKLVVTQFSSVAIEAGFYGIPGLWVLLPEAGGARLREKKGYEMPPPCAAGAAAHAYTVASLHVELARLLRDDACRTRLMRCFDAYFGVFEQTAPKTAARLRALAL